MKKIDYLKLKKEASDIGISLYTLIKREIKYRKKTSKDFRPGDCSTCSRALNPVYDGETRMQCLDIGIIKDSNADVMKDHVCDRFKRISAGM